MQRVAASKHYVIDGRVIDTTSHAGLPGIRLEAWDEDRRSEAFIGDGTSDERGVFRIEFSHERLRDLVRDGRPDLFFHLYWGGRLVASTEHGIRWSPRWPNAEIIIPIDSRILKQPPGSGPPPTGYVVRGQLRDAAGMVIAGVEIKAVDKDLRSEYPLGTSKTDNDGRYEIHYMPKQISKPEKGVADLVVRAYAEDGSVLVESSVHFNVGAEASVDLMVGGGQYAGPSEFERLVAEITPLLDGAAPADLTDDDVKFLAGETDEPAERIGFWVTAVRAAGLTDIPAEAYYGLFRESVPTDLPKLLAQSPVVLRQALEAAVSQNIAPISLKTKVDTALDSVQKLAVKQSLQNPVAGQTSLGSLLGTVLTTPDLQEKLVTAYVNHGGPIQDFWKTVRSDPAFGHDGVVDQVQNTLQFAFVAQNHLPLMKALQANPAVKAPSDLATLDEPAWRALVNSQQDGARVGVPSDVPGRTDPEKETNFIKVVTGIIEEAFPTQVVASRVKQNPFSGSDDLLAFIAASQDFDLKRTNVDQYLALHPSAINGLKDPQGTIQLLKSTQRVLRVTGRYDSTQALLSDGFHSAQSIALAAHDSFVNSYGPKVGGYAQAEVIYARAQWVAAAAATIFAKYGAAINNIELAVTPNPPAELEQVPNWQTLFGTLDLCACEHCRSVYGPAAYLADLLSFLKARPWNSEGTGTALDILFQRRPDIGDIELSCANAETPLPYVDLVNEVLESVVSPTTAVPSRQRQTTWTAAELAANPEYINLKTGITDGAYERLAKAVYPWTLPFDLWASQVAIYLNYLGVTRTQLMVAFQKPGATPVPTDLDIAAASLGMTSFERTIIDGTTAGDPGIYWGQPVLDPTALRAVQTILDRSGLAYADLFTLLGTDFIRSASPDQKFDIVSNDPNDPDTCEISKLTIPEMNADGLKRLHRFTRLWRKLGWAIHELDRAITVLNATDIDGPFLSAVADIVQLRADLGVPIEQLLAFYGPIDTQPNVPGQQSLYARLFLNKQVLNPLDAAFALSGGELAVIGQISQHVPAVLATLHISAADFAVLVSAELNDDKLNIANLSTVYRYTVLKRALKARMTDLLSLEALTGASLFATPATTRDFVRRVNTVRQGGLSIPKLDYIYRSLSDSVHGIAPSRDAISLILMRLQNALSRIVDDTAMPDDVTEELLHQQLSTVLPDPAAQQAVAFIRNIPLDTTANRAFIQVNFAFLDPAEAFSNLLVAAQPATADLQAVYRKTAMTYVLARLLAFLRRTHSESTVTQTLSDALKLETGITAALLRSIVKAKTDNTQPAMADYLALVGDGLLATYYQNADLTNQKIARVEHGVDMVWGSGTPDPSIVPGFSVRLAGKLLAPFREAYTFSIRTNGGVRLWVDGTLLIDQWANGLPAEFIAATPIQLIADEQFHDIKLEYTTAAVSNASLQLSWRSVSTQKSVVSADLQFSGAGLTRLEPVVQSYVLLYKLALLVNAFKMTARELAYVAAHGTDFGGFDPNAIPLDSGSFTPALFAQLERLNQLFTLRNALPGGVSDLFDIFGLASSGTATMDQVKDVITRSTGWDRQELSTLVDAAGFGLVVATFKNEVWLVALQACFAMRRRLGVSFAKLLAWARTVPDQPQAEDVKNTVKAQYDDTQWLTIAAPLRDQLREQQRAALVAYLLVHPELATGANWFTSASLFDYYLIDVDMSPCQLTSRIKQAIGVAQLFIQRCLMNLESGVRLSKDDRRRWQWMRSYRVWEANRKVFLYPENWIEPTLRDNKTPFFQDLENRLLQKEVTAENVEEAYLKYLEKLDEVARLEILGEYQQVETDWTGAKTVDILHVVGRTRGGTPFIYYHRQRLQGLTWTPWERIDLDIESDDVLPVIFNRRLYLLWPVFKEKTETGKIPPKGEAGSEAKKYFSIQLAWSEFKKDKWLAKKVSTVALDAGHLFESTDETRQVGVDGGGTITTDNVTTMSTSAQLDQGAFTFKGEFTPSGDLWIGCFAKTETVTTGTVTTIIDFPPAPTITTVGGSSSKREDQRSELIGAFQIDCHGKVSVVGLFDPNYPPANALQPAPGTVVSGELFAESSGQSTLQVPWGTSPATVLHATPTAFELMYGHQDPAFVATRPFFYEDSARTFFVEPTWIYPFVSTQFETDGVAISQLPFYKLYEQRLIHQPDGGDPGPAWRLSDPLVANPTFAAFSVVDSHLAIAGGAGPVAATAASPSAGATALAVPAPARAAAVATAADRATVFDGSVLPYTGYDVAWEVPLIGWQGLIFETFYHPYVCLFLSELNRFGIDGLLQRPVQLQPDVLQQTTPLDFAGEYQPDTTMVGRPYPLEDIDFSASGSYALYNWEIFFHAPLLIATRLSVNQRFEDAQRWFHYIFDPTDRSSAPSPQRFWQVRPFFEAATQKPIQDLLKLLAAAGYSTEKDEFKKQVQEWVDNAFNPHLIARLRISAYQKTVVMKYIDNLIAWGDQLFRQDTIEDINEATLIYVLAAEILGPRPQEIPPRATVAAATFNELPSGGDFSDPLVQIENLIQPTPTAPVNGGANPVPPVLAPTLYFCVPKNDKLLGYWDTVADRLFKIRHCMNIEGVVRQLPLFEPPIDVALLVQAAAAGVDIGSALSDLNAPLPHYRFATMQQKAVELCGEVRGLGAALLGALEKQDGEVLALLRSSNEIQALQAVKDVKSQAVTEAQRALEAVQKSREIADIRYAYYANIQFMNDAEKAHLVLEGVSAVLQAVSQVLELAAGVAGVVPSFTVGAAGWAASPVATVTEGGSNVAAELQSAGKALAILASISSTAGQMSQTIGGYQRRADDWKLQADVSAKEQEQLDKQILAAQIRADMAQKELDNQDLLIENAKSLDEAMHDKFTNQDLYDWMVSQVSAVYFQCYQLSYDVAKRAEKAYRFERGTNDSFIQFGYWDSLKKGLLAGEKLYYDLKRMDLAYLDQNRREYELTRHVSLATLDPIALVMLKETGQCFFELPESLYDFDNPGHYMRRLKSVAVTIPCVVGPYTSLNGKLTLLWNTIRANPTTPSGNYLRATADDGSYVDDDRFIDDVGAMQSIVTSTGQDDTGLFEVNLHDERYLPFEGRGAVSRWRLELPQLTNAFDFTTIADVVLHVRYTARDGGDTLKKKAVDAVVAVVPGAGVRLFSVRHEFPSAWYAFLNPPDAQDGQALVLSLTQDRFPFMGDRQVKIAKLDFFLKVKSESAYRKAPGLPLPVGVTASDAAASTVTLTSNPADTGGLPRGSVGYDGAEKDAGSWALSVSENDVKTLESDFHLTVGTHERLNGDALVDLWIVCQYLTEPISP